MRIGIVSDTHAQVENARSAVNVLQELDVTAVLHCGDIGSTAVIPAFSDWPTHFVFGNVDGDEETLRWAIREAGQTCHDRFGEIELDGRRIALLHSDDARRFREVTGNGEYDLVCYGHTHQAESHAVGKTVVLNPGALHRANPYSIAVVDLATLEPTIIEI
jgi:hypothetical protein